MNEFSPRDMLIRALTSYHYGRDRSKQVEIGPSSIGDCRRKVVHMLRQDPETNPDTEILASLLGTFIHSGIEKALASEDPFGDEHVTEFEVSAEGLMGHVDYYHKGHLVITDWKTSVKRNLKDFPSQQYLYQVHVYGYLARAMGLAVERVSIVGIPRDGKMSEIVEYSACYNETIALEGLAWLAELKTQVAGGKPLPEPEKFKAYCRSYCQFFDESGERGCPSASRS